MNLLSIHKGVTAQEIIKSLYELVYLRTCNTSYVYSIIIFKQRKYLDTTHTHLHVYVTVYMQHLCHIYVLN